MAKFFVLCLTLMLARVALAEPLGIQGLVQQKKLASRLSGDGSTTSKSSLTLKNLTQEPLTVSIPAGQTFLPQDPSKNQYMITTEPRTVEVPPGATVAVPELPTMCGSPKSVPPPGPSSVYSPGDFPEPERYGGFMEAISTCTDLEKSGKFEGLPIPEERRISTISQLAVWMMEGERTGKPEDQITPESIGGDICKGAGIKYESLPPKQKEEFDDGVAKIFAAADLTKKTAREKDGSGAPALTPPENPPDSPGELVANLTGRWIVTDVYRAGGDMRTDGTLTEAAKEKLSEAGRRWVIGKAINLLLEGAVGVADKNPISALVNDLKDKLRKYEDVYIEMVFVNRAGEVLDTQVLVLKGDDKGKVTWFSFNNDPSGTLRELQSIADRSPNKYGKSKSKKTDKTVTGVKDA